MVSWGKLGRKSGFSCRYCGARLSNYGYLIAHLRRNHPTGKSYNKQVFNRSNKPVKKSIWTPKEEAYWAEQRRLEIARVGKAKYNRLMKLAKADEKSDYERAWRESESHDQDRV